MGETTKKFISETSIWAKKAKSAAAKIKKI